MSAFAPLEGEPLPVQHQLVLLVDDEPDLRAIARTALERAGFRVIEAGDAASAQALLASRKPELVVLDLGLPDASGLDVLRHLRSSSMLPVIVVTALGDEADRIVGLELGADDYVVKPFSPRELAARVRAVLRRGEQIRRRLVFAPLVIDLDTREVTVDEEPLALTVKEFDLLVFLAQSPRRVLAIEQLLEGVWDARDDWQNAATVSEHVYRLRRKLGPSPNGGRWIGTVRGVGYRFDPADAH